MTKSAKATVSEMEQVTKEKLMGDLRAVVADAEELLKATADQAGERIATARSKAEESLKAARARLDEQEAELIAKTKEVANATEDYVRANPWRAIGLAAVAGFVLCILATRR